MAKVTLSGRQIGGGIVVAAGVAMLASGCLFNPFVNRILKGAVATDSADVMRSYWLWSWGLGALTVWAGRKVGSAKGRTRLDGLSVLLLIVAGTILFDRFLLTRFGLTLWEHDPELHYRQRPGIVRTLAPAGRPDDLVRINEWGHHDDEFPQAKPEGELRGLMLGDSVTMGYGVTYAETFSAKLEGLLAESDDKHATHQMINTGVHGYATRQELIVFERSLVFEPDFVVLGFCLNDVTEPFVVDQDLGGTGLDYHGVKQAPNRLSGWLANETGLGRLSQKIAERGTTLDAEKRLELYNVREMSAKSRTDPRYQEAWKIALGDLERVYALAEQEKLPVLLLIFPFTFQLADESLRAPQEILSEHAQAHGVDVVDMTTPLAEAVYDDPDLLAYLRGHGYDAAAISELHMAKIGKYFFDLDHFTGEGNAVVAAEIHGWLQRRQLAD
ncbi:MAG: SGNH/GDSL hydrolase family protein [Myxococcota bacterium]